MEARGSRLMPVTREIVPKTYDIDFAGHVSNISYIRWLEDLRLAWLDEYSPLSELMADGIGPVLLRTEIDYLQPIRLLECPVVGTLWVAGFDRLRSTLETEFRVGSEVKARARQTGLFFKLETGRPVRIPTQILKRLEQEKDNTA